MKNINIIIQFGYKIIIHCRINVTYIFTATEILWNKFPLTLRYLYDDPLTYGGGLIWKNNQCQYNQNIPDFLKIEFPMLGTSDISTSNENILDLPGKTLIFMVKGIKWRKPVDMDGWIDTGYSGNFLSCHNKPYLVSIYSKVFDTGRYIIDNSAATYLFSKPGISKLYFNVQKKFIF